MKKKLLVLAALAICLAIAATGTLAYVSREATARNVITTGTIKVELVEHTKDANGNWVKWPSQGITGVMPGSTAYKKVEVKNTGNKTAWIRAKLDVEFTGTKNNANDTSLVKYSIMDGWVEGADGYYYYTKPLAGGQTTSPLMEQVKFDAKMGNDYQNCKANVTVAVQAVQFDNNGETYTQAKGWPNP